MSDLDLALNKHKYKLLDGRIAVNVTTISGLLDDGKSGAFAGAAVKLTKEGVNYRDEWNARAERGTRVHGHCESFLRGEDIDCLPSEMGYVDAVELFMVEHVPLVVELEQIALSSKGFGGRFDMIVEIEGENWLLDLKTGKKYAVEHTLQLSAYRFADGLAVFDEEGALTSLRPLPEIDRAGCLYVNEDGTYTLSEYPADLLAFKSFCNLLSVYQWARTDDVKAVVKESRAK